MAEIPRRLRQEIVTQVMQSAGGLVLSAQDLQIGSSRRDRLYFIIPAPLDKTAEKFVRVVGSSLLAPENRIRERIKHTRSECKTKFDLKRIFQRLEVNALNTDGQLPLAEHLMALVQSSKVLKDLDSIPAGVGSVINFLASLGVPVLKLFTADSGRSKIISAIANPLIGTGVSAVDTVLPLAFYVNSGRIENGLDMGDQVADIGTLIAFQKILENPNIPENRKKKIARAFIAEYTAEPSKSKQRAHRSLRRAHSVLKPVSEVAGKVSDIAGEIDRVVDVPGVGEVRKIAKIVKGVNATAENAPVTMQERVNQILSIINSQISNLNNQIKNAQGYTKEQLELKLIILNYRKQVATILRTTYYLSRSILEEAPK